MGESIGNPQAAALYPPPSPKELSEAGAQNALTESQTIAGLHALVLRSAERVDTMAQRYFSDARGYFLDAQETAKTLHAVHQNSVQMQRDYASFMEVLRKPIQPRPTVAETVGSAVEHIVTELRKGLSVAFGHDPELQDKAQRLVDGVVEKGKALIESTAGAMAEGGKTPAGGPPAPSPGPESAPAPKAEAPAAESISQEDVVTWMDALGPEYCGKLMARFRVQKATDITGPAVLALREAYKTLTGL